MKLITLSALDIMLCPARRPRLGYTPLDAATKEVLLKMAAKEWDEKNKDR